jgi:hypothetical protein
MLSGITCKHFNTPVQSCFTCSGEQVDASLNFGICETATTKSMVQVWIQNFRFRTDPMGSNRRCSSRSGDREDYHAVMY